MMDDSSSRRLSILRSESAASLRSFLRLRTGAAYATSATADRMDAGAVVSSVHVNLVGQTIFLDDERRLRALAKEIKALISEDKRRGLGL